jgi:hypothetical protein
MMDYNIPQTKHSIRVSWVEMAKRVVWPVLGPASQARLENRAGLSKHTGLISCPSPARSGSDRSV